MSNYDHALSLTEQLLALISLDDETTIRKKTKAIKKVKEDLAKELQGDW